MTRYTNECRCRDPRLESETDEQAANELRRAGEHRKKEFRMETHGRVLISSELKAAGPDARTRPGSKENVASVGHEYRCQGES